MLLYMLLSAKSYNSRRPRVSQGALVFSPQGHEQGDDVDLRWQYFVPRWSVSDNRDKESPSARGHLAHLDRGEMVFANLSSNSLYSRIIFPSAENDTAGKEQIKYI